MGYPLQYSGLKNSMDCIVHEIQPMTEPLSLHLLKSYFFTYYFSPCCIFVAVRRLPLAVVSRGYSLLRCSGFSLQGVFLLWNVGSRVSGFSNCSSWALDHRLSSCDSWALEPRLSNCDAWVQLPLGVWNLLGPGIKPVSLVLAGRFFATEPPGKPYIYLNLRSEVL